MWKGIVWGVYFRCLQLHRLPGLEAGAGNWVLCSIGYISWGPQAITFMRAAQHDTSGPPKGDAKGKLPPQYGKILGCL